MTSMERVLTALSHKEPDRVPNFLLLTMHGAKELNISLEQYFSNPDAVVEGQLKLKNRYSTDCYYSFLYAPLEVEALGAEVIFTENGPPNTGSPILSVNDIRKFHFPKLSESEPLLRVIKVINKLSEYSKGEVPIIGVVMSPFSLPVMQLGFEKYLEIMFNDATLFHELMIKNVEFCIRWANAQLEAGATAICYFDPVSSPSMIPKEQFTKLGLPLMQKVCKSLNGPMAVHMASGRIIPIVQDVIDAGAAVLGVSVNEDINEIKEMSYGKASILGNLNGIEMANWTIEETEDNVKALINQCARGGGFLLSDNHGEIPFQVKEETLLTIAETIEKWGQYPIHIS